jgi:hypothetical protein
MAQIVEWLPSKHKALSSNPNPTKKKKDTVKRIKRQSQRLWEQIYKTYIMS